MDHLPNDPFMLMSSINMLLRDGEFDTLEDLCASFDRTTEEVLSTLRGLGFEYDEGLRQFR